MTADALEPAPREDLARLFGPRNALVPSWLREGARALARESEARRIPVEEGRLRRGDRVGLWVVKRLLGAGGQGEVYLAVHGVTQQPAAVKVPRTDAAARLLREGRLLARLDHPRIVRALDATFDGDTPYLAMQHLAGGSLADAISALRAKGGGAAFTPERIYAIASGVLEALEYAHARGVVHRDVKPANILFDAEGRVLVADFGIGALSLAASERAREGGGPRGGVTTGAGVGVAQSAFESAAAGLTGGGTLHAGTPLYMAPEQEDASRAPPGGIDGRADLFALGKVLYECLTLRSPRTIRPVSLDRRDVSNSWDDFIFRLVEERPEDRPASATEARKRLAEIAYAATSLAVAAPVNPDRVAAKVEIAVAETRGYLRGVQEVHAARAQAEQQERRREAEEARQARERRVGAPLAEVAREAGIAWAVAITAGLFALATLSVAGTIIASSWRAPLTVGLVLGAAVLLALSGACTTLAIRRGRRALRLSERLRQADQERPYEARPATKAAPFDGERRTRMAAVLAAVRPPLSMGGAFAIQAGVLVVFAVSVAAVAEVAGPHASQPWIAAITLLALGGVLWTVVARWGRS